MVASRAAARQASGSSALTWMIGASKPLARSRRIVGRATLARPGGEADLVVGDEVDGAAGGVARQARQVERLGHHALGGEGRVAVEQDRHDRGWVLGRDGGGSVRLLGAGAPLDHRVDGFQVAGVGCQRDAHGAARRRGHLAVRAQVVLHVVEAALGRQRTRGLACLELGEDRLQTDAHDVAQDVEAAAVRHTDDHVARPDARAVLDDPIEHRDHGVQALDAEALLAEVGLVQEALEALDPGEAGKEVALRLRVERGTVLAGLDDPPQPDPFLVTGDVLDLVGDGPRVGGRQVGERLGQRRAGHVDPHQLGGDAGHVLLVEAERGGIQRRVAGRVHAQRVKARGHVAEVAVRLDECHSGGDRLEVLVAGGRAADDRIARRWGGHLRRHRRLEGGEDIGVERVLPAQRDVDGAQERARLGALDDPMVVGAGDRHQPLRADAADGAGGDDAALVRHEPRDRCGRAQGPRVGQRDRGAGHVVRPQFVGASLLDELLVARQELREVHAVGALDDRHHQESRPVGALDVDGQPKVDAPRIDSMRGAVTGLQVVVGHRRLRLRGLHDGVPDQVGEAHLAGLDLLVELAAALLHDAHVKIAEAGGGGDRQAGGHVAGEAGGGALDRRRALGQLRRWRRLGRRGCRWAMAARRQGGVAGRPSALPLVAVATGSKPA